MATFIDDTGEKVKAVTAEQHALDNPGHRLTVEAEAETSASGHRLLMMYCTGFDNGADCDWWNEEGYK